MKRRDVIRHLEEHGCIFIRESAHHTGDRNPKTGQISTVPRHTEIADRLVLKIGKDLQIAAP